MFDLLVQFDPLSEPPISICSTIDDNIIGICHRLEKVIGGHRFGLFSGHFSVHLGIYLAPPPLLFLLCITQQIVQRCPHALERRTFVQLCQCLGQDRFWLEVVIGGNSLGRGPSQSDKVSKPQK